MYPAVAVADALGRRSGAAGVRCVFAGSRARLEWEAAPRAGYEVVEVPAVALPRGGSRLVRLARLALLPLQLLVAVVMAAAALSRLRPKCVVGTGGYIALPTCLAAWALRVPLVVLESNAHPGAANRLLARVANVCGVAFGEAAAAMGPRAMALGNPTRAALARCGRGEACERLGLPVGAEQEQVLLVLGGSLGAGAINDAVEVRTRECQFCVGWKGRGLVARAVQVHRTDRSLMDNTLRRRCLYSWQSIRRCEWCGSAAVRTTKLWRRV